LPRYSCVVGRPSSVCPNAARFKLLRKSRYYAPIVGCFVFFTFFSATLAAAGATITETDVLVAARALSFLQNPPTGDVRVGVVYSPGDPRSVEEADELQQILASGLKVGNLTMTPLKVKVDELATANVQLLWLTSDIGRDGERVADATKAKQIPCITVDIAAVHNGACVMGVRSQPRVEIIVNRAAAARSSMSFATAFRMLVTEI
jgi:hypothetical protein